MVGSNASEVKNLLENTELLGKLLGRESRSVVRQVFLWHNAEIATSVLEVCLGLESLMGVQVALKFHMGITGRVVDEDTAATIHIVVLGFSARLEQSALRRTDKMIRRNLLTWEEISGLEYIGFVLDLRRS